MAMSPQEENDYKRLRALEQALVRNPETELELNKLIRKVAPDAKLPKLEAIEMVESVVDKRLKAQEEEVKSLRQRLLERDASEANERELTKLKRAPYNLSAEDIDAVKALVTEKYKEGEVLSLSTAARYYISQHTPLSASAPFKTPYSTRGARPKNDFRKELRNPKSRLFTDTRQYIQEQYDDAWNEGLDVINSQQS